jgi:hypothetical protein
MFRRSSASDARSELLNTIAQTSEFAPTETVIGHSAIHPPPFVLTTPHTDNTDSFHKPQFHETACLEIREEDFIQCQLLFASIPRGIEVLRTASFANPSIGFVEFGPFSLFAGFLKFK